MKEPCIRYAIFCDADSVPFQANTTRIASVGVESIDELQSRITLALDGVPRHSQPWRQTSLRRYFYLPSSSGHPKAGTSMRAALPGNFQDLGGWWFHGSAAGTKRPTTACFHEADEVPTATLPLHCALCSDGMVFDA
jgi:hypothetical protein